MFIADLSTRAYFARGERVRAIGWLEGDHPYTRGAVPGPFLQRLKQHVESAYQPTMLFGFHECTLCPRDDPNMNDLNLLIPTAELLYMAPAMIVHYIEDHDYRPPEEFIAAVMACPAQQSAEFMALLERFPVGISPTERPPVPPRFGTAPAGVTCRARRAAYAVIRDAGGRVAAIRVDGPDANRYSLPGGGIEADETAEVAVFREVREELGRWIRLVGTIGETVQIFYAAADACWYEMTVILFEAEFVGQPMGPGERELHWLDPETQGESFFHASHAWAASHG